MKKEIRVLVVDDTPFKREIVTSMLQSAGDIRVIGTASDGLDAVKKTKLYSPDVITMDIKMPNMDGYEAIGQIMSKNPTPIIIVSVTVREHAKFVFKCLGLGALDFVPVMPDMEKMREEIIGKVRLASKIPVVTHPGRIKGKAQALPDMKKQIKAKTARGGYAVVAIAVSTGGPEALKQILSKLPKSFPVPVLIVQHISEGFVRGLADWLKDYCRVNIKVAAGGMKINPGTVYFAPSGQHMEVTSGGCIKLISNKMGYLNCPSADVTLKSAVKSYGSRVIGVILTGMGDDGVEGIGVIKEKGGFTIAQDENSSIIYGMPRVASEKGYISNVTALEKIPDLLIWMTS